MNYFIAERHVLNAGDDIVNIDFVGVKDNVFSRHFCVPPVGHLREFVSIRIGGDDDARNFECVCPLAYDSNIGLDLVDSSIRVKRQISAVDAGNGVGES